MKSKTRLVLAFAAAASTALADVTVADLAARPGSPVVIRIAAANSTPGDRAAADFVCTGTNDEVVLNRAIELLVKGGTVKLADGDYYVDAFPHESNTAVLFGYNEGRARVINVEGGTENKSYNTRFGVGLHVTARAFAAMKDGEDYHVFCGTVERPKAPGDFYTMTFVNNVNFANFYLLFHDASKRICGIDGRYFGNLYLYQIGVYTERYFQDRFLHEKPAPPVRGSIGIISPWSSNDEMSRVGYDFAYVGGMHTGFLFCGVDHLVMRSCTAARCCYGFRTMGKAGKELTMINCSDEGNTHLPRFDGTGQLTAIDFNIERFNADYIPDSPEDVGPYATEETPGKWRGFISYTLQGKAYGLRSFWKPGHGVNFRTINLKRPLDERPDGPEYLETYFDKKTNKTLTWNGSFWVDAMGNKAD